MAGNSDDLVIHIGADISDLNTGLSKADTAVGNLNRTGAGLASGGGGLFGALKGGAGSMMAMVNPAGLAVAGVGLLGGALVGATKAAADEAVGIERMNTALKNNIPGWAGNTDAVEGYISQQEKLSFADDDLRDSLGWLVGQTHDLGEAQDLQATAMDLARAKGIDLMSATKLVGKVDADNIGILKRYGINVDENMTKEQALAAIRQQSAGQAQTYANTAAGSMDRLGVMMGDLAENVGGVILPLVTGGLQLITNLAQGLSDFLGPLLSNIGLGFQKIAEFLSPLLGPFQQFFDAIGKGKDPLDAFQGLLNNLGGVLADLGGKIVKAVQDALPKIWEQLQAWGTAFMNWLPQAAEFVGKAAGLAVELGKWIIDEGLPLLISKLIEWGGAFIGWIAPQILPMLGKLGELLLQLGQWLIGTALPTIVSKLAEWGGAFLGWILPKIPGLLSNLGQVLLNIGTWIITTALPAIVQKLGEWGAAFIGWVGKDALPFIGQKLGEFAQAIWTWITETAKAIPAKVMEIGKGLVDGIRQGIKNAWDGLINWLSGMIKDHLPGFMKDWLGIHSPSTVMAEIGENMMLGLQQGAEGEKDATAGAVTSVLGNMLDAVHVFLDKNGDADTSLPEMWRDAFNSMYQFIQSAWGPQMDDQFKFWFMRWRGYFDDFRRYMDGLGTPGLPPDTGGGDGGGGTGGGGGGGGGRTMRSQGGGSAPFVVVMDGQMISHGLATRQSAYAPQPSVIMVNT